MWKKLFSPAKRQSPIPEPVRPSWTPEEAAQLGVLLRQPVLKQAMAKILHEPRTNVMALRGLTGDGALTLAGYRQGLAEFYAQLHDLARPPVKPQNTTLPEWEHIEPEDLRDEV